ncbi:MAG TPA: beta-glucosidase BglX [Solirubrobacterales bacterium]|jgi:beta-glucosidase|nr:beta-glucosidase BglX [Solirubrobacterales bacterium]
MTIRRRLAISTIALTLAAVLTGLVLVGAGGVFAGTRPTDHGIPRDRHHGGGGPGHGGSIDRKVDSLLRQMTTHEKLEQLTLSSDGQITVEAAEEGVGSVFSLVDPQKIDELQHAAVERSRLHIPILFAYDTIHGYRTIFPTPLAEASSFDPAVAESDDTIAARESAAVGIKQVYSPMVDISHEPRWGRIVEGSGEDPYLGSVFAAARVHALQGEDPSAPDKVLASPKHFVAYGQPEGGREYNTTDMSGQRLWNFYLPPFKAAIDAGALTVMCSFNAINGVPGCANHLTETEILKKHWGFDGFIESDYTAVAELRACPPVEPDEGPCGHGIAADGPEAARAALEAGTDSEMVSTNYLDFGEQLLEEHKLSISRVNDAVRRILTVKFKAGLFDHPYVDLSQIPEKTMQPEDIAAERAAASRSMVLLKDGNGALPLSSGLKSVAVVGPLGNDKADPLGPWSGQGKPEDVVTLKEGIEAALPGAKVTPAEGCDPECTSEAGFGEAVAAAEGAEVTVLALGESAAMSGEASSRANLDVPGRQQQLLDAIAATGKPFVVVLMNGHPLTLEEVDAKSPAILEAWFPGIQAGNAIADVLFGKVDPGGKLPVTFPRSVGQLPLYYNHEPTGRPADPENKYTSKYLDEPVTPLYPFGYGLSYTKFNISNVGLSSQTMSSHGVVEVSADVTNEGKVAGDEVVQLYIHDPVASIEQPVRRLRGFQRVTLEPGETKSVKFRLGPSDVGFYDELGNPVVEPGEIEVFVGDSSEAPLAGTFEVVG